MGKDPLQLLTPTSSLLISLQLLLEITITPAAETERQEETKGKEEKIHLTKPMVDKIMQGAVLRSLTGLLHTDMTIEEIRNERLQKHDRIT